MGLILFILLLLLLLLLLQLTHDRRHDESQRWRSSRHIGNGRHSNRRHSHKLRTRTYRYDYTLGYLVPAYRHTLIGLIIHIHKKLSSVCVCNQEDCRSDLVSDLVEDVDDKHTFLPGITEIRYLLRRPRCHNLTLTLKNNNSFIERGFITRIFLKTFTDSLKLPLMYCCIFILYTPSVLYMYIFIV